MILAKKSVKAKYFFYLTITDVQMGRQKVPKSDFQRQFAMSKIILIFIEEYQFRKKFFVIVVFENFDF